MERLIASAKINQTNNEMHNINMLKYKQNFSNKKLYNKKEKSP